MVLESSLNHCTYVELPPLQMLAGLFACDDDDEL